MSETKNTRTEYISLFLQLSLNKVNLLQDNLRVLFTGEGAQHCLQIGTSIRQKAAWCSHRESTCAEKQPVFPPKLKHAIKKEWFWFICRLLYSNWLHTSNFIETTDWGTINPSLQPFSGRGTCYLLDMKITLYSRTPIKWPPIKLPPPAGLFWGWGSSEGCRWGVGGGVWGVGDWWEVRVRGGGDGWGVR